jgi:hypothetical protein
VLYDDTGFDVQRSLEFTGFQYADVLIDPHSDHLLALVRTAYRGANNYHNANRQTLVRASSLDSWSETGLLGRFLWCTGLASASAGSDRLK